MDIKIYQGSEHLLKSATVNIIIDVIRAFTVSHIAFKRGVREIILVNTIEDALKIKRDNPKYLLAGEVGGYKIDTFDLDNSPHNLDSVYLKNYTLVLRTTNGVKATLNSLNAEQVFVTGFSNAKTMAKYVKKIADKKVGSLINIIASHPSSDDDIACAEYIKGIILGRDQVTKSKVIERIKNSDVAKKFFDPNNEDFKKEDIHYCTQEENSDFVMKIHMGDTFPALKKVLI